MTQLQKTVQYNSPPEDEVAAMVTCRRRLSIIVQKYARLLLTPLQKTPQYNCPTAGEVTAMVTCRRCLSIMVH